MYNIIKNHPTNFYFNINESGADYVVGDTHGQYSKLISQLEEIRFNYDDDRLFMVGDVIDRGPESEELLDFIQKPNIHSVFGNHEHMMIETLLGDSKYHSMWLNNGGEWFNNYANDTSEVNIGRLKEWVATLLELPLNITIKTNDGDIGICHAEPIFMDWEKHKNPENYNDDDCMKILWGRGVLQRGIKMDIKNVIKTYHGHTPTSTKKTLGNMNFIDTYSMSGKFHIEQIN